MTLTLPFVPAKAGTQEQNGRACYLPLWVPACGDERFGGGMRHG
jgi:hypothetical protein